jgi:hypothetical protein
VTEPPSPGSGSTAAGLVGRSSTAREGVTDPALTRRRAAEASPNTVPARFRSGMRRPSASITRPVRLAIFVAVEATARVTCGTTQSEPKPRVPRTCSAQLIMRPTSSAMTSRTSERIAATSSPAARTPPAAPSAAFCEASSSFAVSAVRWW